MKKEKNTETTVSETDKKLNELKELLLKVLDNQSVPITVYPYPQYIYPHYPYNVYSSITWTSSFINNAVPV